MKCNIFIRLCWHIDSVKKSLSIMNTRYTCLVQNISGSSSKYCTGKSYDSLKEIGEKSSYSYLENKLKMLELENYVLRQSGHRIPDKIKENQWKNLVEINSKSKRKKYLAYLFKNERSLEKKQKKKEEKQRQTVESTLNLGPDDYCIHKNSMFLQVYEQTMNTANNSRVLHHSQFTQPLIFDCSYEHSMTPREISHAGKQITLSIAENRTRVDPFDLHLCNIEANSKVMEILRRNIPTVCERWYPLHLHSMSYLDKFAKERLVYLTPDSDDYITEYDHDAIYIIGCLVDKGVIAPLSLARAKRDGLKMGKLPLDRYLQWGMGAKKTLTLNQTLSIMLDMKSGKSWEEAFNHVPRRKLELVQQNIAMKNFKKLHLENYENLTRSEKNVNIKNVPEIQKEDKIYYDDYNNINISINDSFDIRRQQFKTIPEFQHNSKNYYKNTAIYQNRDSPNKHVSGIYNQRRKNLSAETLFEKN